MRVVAVADGDTITVLDSEKKQRKVRINGVDAPEKGQAFDEQSPQERGPYASEEEEAHLRKRGLWADQAPVPPWEWREGGSKVSTWHRI